MPINIINLPAQVGNISDAAVTHVNEGGVDKKLTFTQLLAKVASVYNSFVQTFLASTTKAEMRAAMDIARRVAFSNVDYTVINVDKVIAQTGTMSAPRTVTLPAANSIPAGEELIVIDESGTVTSANKITVARSGSDLIDGATSFDIVGAYGFSRFISNGTNGWKVARNIRATSAEAITGIDDFKFVTPAGMKAKFDDFMPIAVRFNAGNPSTILSSKGISSLTRLASGNHRLNFTTPMADANYYVAVATAFTNFTPTIGIVSATTTTLEIQIQKWDNANFTSNPDLANCTVFIIRN